MISTELDSRRVAAPDERATLFPTGGACSSLATAVRLQRLDGLLGDSTAIPVSALATTGTPALAEALPPFDERSERHRCQVAWAPGRRKATGSGDVTVSRSWHLSAVVGTDGGGCVMFDARPQEAQVATRRAGANNVENAGRCQLRLKSSANYR
jgi:hypothetical protein